MDKTNSAITAIRNIAIENFVAATLEQIGWTLVYRAISIEALAQAAVNHPGALIIAAEDFGIDPSSFSNSTLFLDARQELTAFHLQDSLRNIETEKTPHQPTLSLCTSEVTVVSTLDAGVGGSTSAINIAYQISRMGRKTLLLDFNTEGPSLARYFDTQRINRSIAPTPSGFFIAEASDISFMKEIVSEADEFDEVVIDLGKLPNRERLLSGVRIHEVLSRWSVQSSSHNFIVCRGDAESIDRMKSSQPFLALRSDAPLPTILLSSHSVLSSRDVKALIAKAAEVFGGDVRVLPRDHRSIEAAQSKHAPLSEIAPKSPLAREFSSIVASPRKRGR